MAKYYTKLGKLARLIIKHDTKVRKKVRGSRDKSRGRDILRSMKNTSDLEKDIVDSYSPGDKSKQTAASKRSQLLTPDERERKAQVRKAHPSTYEEKAKARRASKLGVAPTEAHDVLRRGGNLKEARSVAAKVRREFEQKPGSNPMRDNGAGAKPQNIARHTTRDASGNPSRSGGVKSYEAKTPPKGQKKITASQAKKILAGKILSKGSKLLSIGIPGPEDLIDMLYRGAEIRTRRKYDKKHGKGAYQKLMNKRQLEQRIREIQKYQKST